MNLRLSLLSVALISAQSAFSLPSLLAQNTEYPNRYTGQILAGDASQIAGFGDAMLPFMQRKDRIFFADGALMGGDSNNLVYSGGLGYRGILNTGMGRGILGAYAFTEYFDTALNNGYWQLNPGLEWLNERYEARLQGYIPLNSQSQLYSNTFASIVPQNVLQDSGHTTSALNFASFHQVYDTPVGLYEQFGPGVELEAGVHLDYGKGLWLRLGGYHFNYQNVNSINGVEANAEIAMTKNTAFLIQENYDNQNQNRFSVGIRVNLGGSEAEDGTLEQRMTSPIIRHLARQSYGAALPTRKDFKATGPTFVAIDNAWFFSPQGTFQPANSLMILPVTQANCTAENPCLTLDSYLASGIAGIAPNANLLFETGTYDLPSNAGSNWTNLQNGQTILGRNTGWLRAAAGDERPLINGGLFWGTNTTTANGAISDMRVINDNQIIPTTTSFGSGAYGVGATGDMYVNNSAITAILTTPQSTLNSAFAVSASRNATVINSVLAGTVSITGNFNAQAIGVLAVNGTATVANSTLSGNATATNGSSTVRGVQAQNGNAVVSNSTATAISNTSGVSTSATASGIEATNAMAFVTNSTVTSNSKTSGGGTSRSDPGTSVTEMTGHIGNS